MKNLKTYKQLNESKSYNKIYDKVGELMDEYFYEKADFSIIEKYIKTHDIDYSLTNLTKDRPYPFVYSIANTSNSYRTKKYSLMKLLLEDGATISIDFYSSPDDSTSLMLSAYLKDMRMIELLIEYGADWAVEDEYGNDFIDLLDNEYLADDIIEQYPEQAKKYLEHQKRKEFNL